MKIRNARRSDFPQCCIISEKYYGQYCDPYFPFDRFSLIKMLSNFMDVARYFKVMLKDNEVVGWFVGIDGTGAHHSTVTGMTQIYYHTSLKGLSAIAALKAWHEHFFNFVEKAGLEVAITSSSLPNNKLFGKILEQDGWIMSERFLLKPTRFYSPDRRPNGYGILPGSNRAPQSGGGHVHPTQGASRPSL